MPSEASRISSKLFRPSWFSILEMIWMFFAAVGFQVLTDLDDVGTFTDEGGRDKVHALFATEDQILFVFLSQRRRAMERARQVYACSRQGRRCSSTLQITLLPSDSRHFHADQAIVHQERCCRR